MPDTHDLGFANLNARLTADTDGRMSAMFAGYHCRSALQPVVSLTHARVVGHEGLLRASDADGKPVAPPVLLNQAIAAGNILELDRLCRAMHVANSCPSQEGWIFLNMHPEGLTLSQQKNRMAFMADMLAHYHLEPKMVVLEILEEAIADEAHFRTTVAQLREMGCLLAIDDFGAGHSNFDRIWEVAPEIVKLDRRFAVQCEADPRARRMLPRIVNMLHEAGSLVLLEGIETLTQAMIALEADVDFAQGYFFARPEPQPLPIHQIIPSINELWDRYEQGSHQDYRQRRNKISPYEQAMIRAAMDLAAKSENLEAACRSFLDLPNTEFCYLLDGAGLQVGENVWRNELAQSASSNYKPIAGINGARWSRRPYFRRAVEHFGQVQTTRPYLSTATGHLCVTISIAFHLGQETRVLCGDLRWS